MPKAFKATLVLCSLLLIAVFYQNCGQEFQSVGSTNLGSNLTPPPGGPNGEVVAAASVQAPSRKSYASRVVNVVFSEDVTGFSVDDLAAVNAVIMNANNSLQFLAKFVGESIQPLQDSIPHLDFHGWMRAIEFI